MAGELDVTYFENANGKKIACYAWEPKEKARALVFICHGAGEHCGCYNDVAKVLNNHNFKVFGHDHIGHGLSEGARVHVSSFSEYVNDVFQHVEKVKKENEGLPCFIVGHSMGGCIALRASMVKPDVFKGMVLLGPAVVPNPVTATRFKLCMARVLSKVVPQCPVGKIDPKFICRDPKVVEDYQSDPLVYHGGLKAKWGVEIVWAMREITDNPDKITVPMLVIMGSEDKLVEMSGIIYLKEKAASSDKTVQILEGAYHQVHKEPDGVGEKCVQDISDWIANRC